MRKIMTAIAFTMAALAAPAQAAIIDGRFEAQGAGANYGSNSYCYFNPASGAPAICGNPNSPWGGDSGLIQSGSGPWGGTAAFDGAYYSFVQQGGALTQTFSVARTGNYWLTWVDAQRSNTGGAQDYMVSISGTGISDYVVTESTEWRFHVRAFLLLPGQSYTLTFQGLNSLGGDNTAFIDAVGLIPIPEPSTWALMIGGFGMVGGAMRRRSLSRVARI